MSIANRFNKSHITWNYETEGFEFKKCNDLKTGKVYKIHGFFKTADKGFGEGMVVILDDCLLNVPQSAAEMFIEMQADNEAVEAIKNGMIGIKLSTYQSKKFKRLCYNVELVDIEN